MSGSRPPRAMTASFKQRSEFSQVHHTPPSKQRKEKERESKAITGCIRQGGWKERQSRLTSGLGNPNIHRHQSEDHWVWLDTGQIPSQLPVAMAITMNKSNLKTGVDLSLHFQALTERTKGRSSGQELSRDHGVTLLTNWLTAHSLPSLFLCHPGPPSWRWHWPMGWVLLHQWLIKKMPYEQS